MQWHIVTGEFPPQSGGMSDYTCLVAEGLAAAGDEVHVWCPAGGGEIQPRPGVVVHRELGRLAPADLRRCGALLDRFPAPRNLLVQWTPHAYGFRSLNVPFCFWLWRRASQHGDQVQVMAHEACLEFRAGAWKQSGAAAVHRLMMALLLQASQRVWLSIPAWEERFRPYSFGGCRSFPWLPVPSNVPVSDDPGGVRNIRSRYLPEGGVLLGHFGTYGLEISKLLEAVVPEIMSRADDISLLLAGRGSEEFRERLGAVVPGAARRIHATGGLTADRLSLVLRACDLMVQPYPDGVSSRRGSVMAALAHGRPIITTRGPLTEPIWEESDAVDLVPVEDLAKLAERVLHLAADPQASAQLGARAGALYASRFDIRHTIAAFRATASAPPTVSVAAAGVA